MSITRAQRARFHDYAPTPEDIEAVMLALDTATERLSNERSKRSQAEARIKAVERVLDYHRQGSWSPFHTIEQALRWAIEGEPDPGNTAPSDTIRRALDGDA